MQRISRHRLAKYAADSLLAGKPASGTASHLAAVLVASKRERDVEFLVSDISNELEERGELSRVTVTSAVELNEKLRQEISHFVKKATSAKQVSLNEQIDKSVLGGVRIETPSMLWDKTVAKSLADIKGVF